MDPYVKAGDEECAEVWIIDDIKSVQFCMHCITLSVPRPLQIEELNFRSLAVNWESNEV